MSRFVFAAAIVFAAPAFAETTYFSAVEDIPLPSGFAESPGWSMATEAGALTEARAEGPGGVADARAFYERSLPVLGWSLSVEGDGSLAFIRGRERLMFGFAASSADRTTIRARLLVRPASMNAD